MTQDATPALPVLPGSASFDEAATLIASEWAPAISVEGPDGERLGVLTEECIRLGIAGELRLHHEILSHLVAPETLDFVQERADGTLSLAPGISAPKIHRALVMAGGRGSRLGKLTEDCPKPLLPIRGVPLLHRILRALHHAGIEDCYLSVHYLADKVRQSIGDGKGFGLRVHYLEEERPLGTAGALGLLPDSDEPLLMMNGDVYCDVNIASLSAWHGRHANRVTVATHLHQVEVPYGLAHYDGQRLRRLEEKPTLRLPVNAGIYLFNPELVDAVPPSQPFDMVSWLNHLAAEDEAGKSPRIGHYPLVEAWNDIGSPSEYERLAHGNGPNGR